MSRVVCALLAVVLCSATLSNAQSGLPLSPLTSLTDGELQTLWQFLQTGVTPSSAPPATGAAPELRSQVDTSPPAGSLSPASPAPSPASSDEIALPLTAATIAQAITNTFSSMYTASLPRLGAWLANWGHNISAIPPDFSQTATFRAENISNSVSIINQTLALLDAAVQQQIQSIPGLAQQIEVIVGNEQGPFKFSPSFTFSPQIRLSFFRTQFGLPQSPWQALQWLLNPTLQLRTDNVEFRQEFYTQTYINFVFADPPDINNLPFILSKRRKSRALLARKTQFPPPALIDTNFTATPFGLGQADCVHTCLADDYRFTERHAEVFGNSTLADAYDTGMVELPFRQLGVPDAALQEHREASSQRRMALDIGPFTFPNVPTVAGVIAAKMAQIRTTLQDFLNLRPQFQVVPFASFIPTSRTGVQVQQRADGKPLTISYYERLGFDTDAAVRETASFRVLTPGTSGFIPLPQLIPAFPNFGIGWASSPFGTVYGALVQRLQALRTRGAGAPAPAAEDVAESPAPEPASPLPPAAGRKLLQSPTQVLPAPDALGFSVVAPLLFPITLLPQWKQFFFDWRNLFGIGNLFDFRVFNALLTGPYTRTTSFIFTPQFRIYLGQIKIGLPRSKNETEAWLRDFSKQLVTDQLSYQVQWRINTNLVVALTPIVPPRPPPLAARPPPRPPPPPKFTHFQWLHPFGSGRRRLHATEATIGVASNVDATAGAAPHKDPAIEAALQALPPAPPEWSTDDPRCAASNFPVLYDAAAMDAIRASQNGTVTHSQWLQAMIAFATGLEELRTTPVPLECVPPLYRTEAAIEAQAQEDQAAGAPPMPVEAQQAAAAAAPSSGRRLMLTAATESAFGAQHGGVYAAALAAARRAHNTSLLTQTALKSLAVQLQNTVFVTALSELVLQSPLTASLNIQNIFQPFFAPYTASLQASLETDFIVGKEALFSFLAPKPPSAATTSTGTRAPTTPLTSG